MEDATGARLDVIPQGEDAVFRARVRFKSSMAAPVFGVIVKSERGEHVFVSNTLFDRVSTGNFDEGEEAIYAIRFGAYFSDGRHTASAAIAHQDAQRYADWREDAVSFSVRGERYSGGLVDLPHETWVERVTATEHVRNPVDA